MLDKVLAQLRAYDMVQTGDRLICAVSGGADSVALLWSLYLLRQKLGITLEAAHFNHGLRGGESDRDEAFVRKLCDRYDIHCHVGRGAVTAGKKGLEAAARDARYAFLRSLPGKIATAHTADDNAETVLMHLVRGTGLKGLGGISPVNGNVIRPMLTVTREQVLAFLEEYHLEHVEDSSNGTDDFLRNRLRHKVLPLLQEENPRLSQNLSAMAMELREDEAFLWEHTVAAADVPSLRAKHPALRRRSLAQILQRAGVKEPERAHIDMAEKLVFSDKPSAWAEFPGGVILRRRYDRLIVGEEAAELEERPLHPGDILELPGWRITCLESAEACSQTHCFTVAPVGNVVLRSRRAGDRLRLSGGTKTLKKVMIDRKIPEADRNAIPVIADDAGVLGVCGIGVNLDRAADHGIMILFEER